jgi:hypothetical protein
VSRTFDGTERASHTGSLERVLVHTLLRSLPPHGLPREDSSLRPKPSPYSGPAAVRASGEAAHFELARSS